MDQVRQYNPPPNPAKLSDSRSDIYIAEFGGESWELDALEPNVLAGLVRAAVAKVVDNRLMAAAMKAQKEHRETLACGRQIRGSERIREGLDFGT